MCKPGSYSSSGLQPCALCPMGSNQPLFGQTSCTKCALGQISLITGSGGTSNCAGMVASFKYNSSCALSFILCSTNYCDILISDSNDGSTHIKIKVHHL